MINRLRKFLRATPFCVGFCLLMLPTAWLQAQPDFFIFNYNGPSSLSVGPTCSSMLQGNVPNPVVTSTMGFPITMSMFDPVASGFQYNDLFTSGTIAHVFWFVKDNMGHSHTYEYFINFVDNTPPTFNLNGVFDTLEFTSIVQVPAQTALPVADNCTPVVSDTFFQTSTPDTCQSGTFTRTWKATDANSNTAVYTQTIIIYKDTLPPQITGYPLNGSSSCEKLSTAYPAWRALQIANFSATDASGIKALTNNAPVNFPPGCKVPLTVMFKAIDNCQNQLPLMVTFTTSDTKGPVIIKAPKDTVAYCSQNDNELTKLRQWIGTKAYSQVFDSCSSPLTYTMKIGNVNKDSVQVIAAFLASFSGGCNTVTIGGKSYSKVHGFVSVDFFVKDACGNQTPMGNADFGAIDTLPPVITGSNVFEQCGGGNDQTTLQAWINAHGNATVTEDCSGFTWTNFSFTTSTGQAGDGNFNAGPYPIVQANNCAWFTNVTFRATDDCGNSNTVNLRFSIIDTQAPAFIGLQPNITVFCPNPLPTVPAAILNDNCDASVVITFSRVYKDSLCDGSYTVFTTWRAFDDCGNSSSAMQNIFVSDTTKPVFTLIPANKTFRCDTFVLPPVPVMGVNIMASDGCSPVVSITTATNSFQNPDPAVCGHYSYNIVRTFTASDECGNTRTATQTISVIDNLGPAPGGILDTTALCSALLPFPAPVPIATDACSGLTAAPTKTGQTTTPGACTDQSTITVHWTASDVCGNTTTFNQIVHVIDTVPPTLLNIPPNVTVECDAIPTAPSTGAFNAADNCDLSVTVSFLETEIRNPDTTICAHWTDYVIKREWTATDNCGNSRTYTQLIQIEDTTPPVIIPPAAMMFPNDLGDCGADLTIPAPLSVTDVCSDQLSGANISATKPLVQNGPGSPFSTPVASMTFQLAPPNVLPFQPAAAGPNTELRIIIEKADAEGSTEFFNVFDENNILLGTANTNSQCGDKTTVFSLNPSQLNGWLSDGTANFTVVPNGTGAMACNPICSGGKVTARLVYSYSSSDVPIALTYSLDGGPSQNFPPVGQTFLTEGTHTVIYTATDCAGNSATSSVQITINDTQPPSMATPANITVFTAKNNCESTVTLPFPAITENCAMSANLSIASAVLPLNFENDGNVGLVAIDISPNLTGLIPNAVGTGILKIRHKGDNAQSGEFFIVYDESGNLLDSTLQGTISGECSTFFETSISVTALQINTWAGLNGATSFYLESNRNSVNYTDFVGNCAPLLPNGTDGISKVQVTLEYSYAVVNYAVKKPVNQTVATGTLTGNTTMVTLPPANYTVMYTTTDNAGLTGMTSFTITVRDSVKPRAICDPTVIIKVDPSGAGPYMLLPDSINNGSFDNCTPIPNLSYAVSPNSFNCNQAGTSVIVTLTVTDASGNSATCNSSVGVTSTPPLPSYTPVCENNTLKLMANPPSTAPFSYLWSGPNMYFNNTDQNPIVTTNAMAIHNGTYCVTITGATGCTSFSCVPVALAILGVTPALNPIPTSYCPGQNIVLGTNTYQGQFVSYQWFVDSMPALPGGPIVLDTTLTPVLSINNPPPGNYTYYVKVFANGCNTTLSNALMATVHPSPLADAVPEMTQVCEGQSISLQSPTPPTAGLMYLWTGPNGFTSMLQNPSVTNNAVKSLHGGKYVLVTKRNGCFSSPDTVMVNINLKPAKPSISGNVNVCVGQTIMLVSSVANGIQWIWTSPTFDDISTDSNSLNITNADDDDEGNWRVLVSANGCSSDISDPIHVEVQDYPIVNASPIAPFCQDSLLKLSATFSSVDPIALWCWTGPNNFVKFEQNPTIPNGASGLYQVIAKTSFGCADTATVNVTNVAPPLITSISNNAPACCDGTTDATLSAAVVSFNAPLTYLWTGPPAFGTSTLPNPVIADVCTPYNGQYTLVVKDAFGCPSLPATTGINIQAPPATPMVQVNLTQPVCAGVNLLLTITNQTSGASYLWDRPPPFTDTVTTLPTSLSIPNAQTWHSGQYTVKAISGNGTCQSGPSSAITVTVNPIPPAPFISSNSPVCEGGVLELYGTSVSGVSYRWTGPAAFIDTINQNPVRQPVTLNMEGEYRMKVTIGGCSSPEAFTFVNVVPMPQAPQIADPPNRICIDGPVTAFLNILNPVNGMIYTWEDATSGIDLQSSTATSLNLGMPNVLALGPGTHMFRVFATTAATPGCNSAFSGIRSVTFDTIPAGINAFAGQDFFACDGKILLAATAPSGAVKGIWTQIGGPSVTIDNADSPNASFVGEDTIYYFQWSLSNGACMDFDRDTVKITAQEQESASATPDQYYCEPVGIQLHATQGITAQGMWVQSSQQAQLGVVNDSLSDPNTTISGNVYNGQNYAFNWEIGNIGCGTSSAPTVVYIYSTKPNAGAVQFVCDNQNCAELGASLLANFEFGVWSSPGLTFTNASSPNTTVCGLKPGRNEIYWIINDTVCGSNSMDTVDVFFELSPTAVNDVVSVNFGDTVHFNVLLNDILPTSFNLTILTAPTPGAIIDTLGQGIFVYRPLSGFSGDDVTMEYLICNTKCPSSCFIGTVTFKVGGAPDCFIPTIITPNGDGFNDQFKIPDECMLGMGNENLDVAIFNQWGDLVFQAKPYLNDWGGTYNKADVPAGTYFVVIKLNEQDKPKTGFLLIQR